MDNKIKLKNFKGFAKLVKRIAKIDEDSAVWLIDNQIRLHLGGVLGCLMTWENTPQGRNHWQKINEELKEKYYDY